MRGHVPWAVRVHDLGTCSTHTSPILSTLTTLECPSTPSWYYIMDLPECDLLSPQNLQKLRLDSTPSPVHVPPTRPRIIGQFLRGPIPLAWLEKAAKLPGKAPLAVALAIRFESGRRNNARSVKLTNPLV